MNGPVLTLFAALVAALFVSGCFGLLRPATARPVLGLLCGTLSGLAGTLALFVLLLPGEPAELQLPIGLPGIPLSLALDPLSGGFLLLIAIAGTAAIVFAAEAPAPDAEPVPGLAIALAGLLLAILAGDGITLGLGLALGGGAIWSTVHRHDPGRPTAAPLAIIALAVAAVIIALGLLAPAETGLRFASIRAVTLNPVRAEWAELVTVIGLGGLFGLAPLHAWLVPAQRGLPAPSAALLSGALLPTALYVLLRLLLDLEHAASPLAGSLPLLLGGTAAVLISGWQACRSRELDNAVAFGSLRQSGMAAIALALVIIGRASDLPDLGALALSAVLLLAAMQAICGTLAVLAAGAICQQAAIRRLDRLGGLIHAMPVSTAGLITGLAGLSGFPPAPGFAVLFLLFQAVLAAPRHEALGRPLLLIVLVLLIAAGSLLASAALVRLTGMACLGRPRVPRASAAEELPSAARPALLLPMLLTGLLGLLPGPVVRLLAGGAIRDLSGAMLAEHIGWLTLAPGAASPGYAPIPIALLLALAACGALWWQRRHTRADRRLVPIWQDGFAAAPPWLPFGDPVTQWNGALPLPDLPTAGRPPLRALLGQARRITAPALALAAATILLALLAWPGLP